MYEVADKSIEIAESREDRGDSVVFQRQIWNLQPFQSLLMPQYRLDEDLAKFFRSRSPPTRTNRE